MKKGQFGTLHKDTIYSIIEYVNQTIKKGSSKMENQEEVKTQPNKFAMNKNVKRIIIAYCSEFCGRSNACSSKCPLMRLKEEATKVKPKRKMSDEQLANLRKSHRTNKITDTQFQEARNVAKKYTE